MPKLYPFLEKSLIGQRAAQILLMVNLCALGFALTVQYGLGFQPCILCLWQRVPYVGAALLAALALRRSLAVYCLGLCSLLYLGGMGLAIFHSGVELHWWAGTAGCAVKPLAGTSAELLRESLLHTDMARCDQISWTFFGLSMTNWNALISLTLAFWTAAASAHKASLAE